MSKFLLSRRVILAVILLIAAASMIAYLVPQLSDASPAAVQRWRASYQFLLPVVDALDLDQVFSAPWFAALVAVFFLSLARSTVQQLVAARHRTFGGAAGAGARSFSSGASPDEVDRVMRHLGYLRIFEADGVARYAKHPWGHWGRALLHAGMLISVGFALVVLVTEQRGSTQLTVGETLAPPATWMGEVSGVFARRLELPFTVRVDSVTPTFWDTDDMRQLTAALTFTAPDGIARTETVAINRPVRARGVRVFEDQSFGAAFFVELVGESGGVSKLHMQLPSPVRRGQAGYGDFDFPRVAYRIRAKYFPDDAGKTMLDRDPRLVLRLVDGTGLPAGQAELKVGGESRLGPYRARLAATSRWVGLVFARTFGMEGVFFGFGVILLGASLAYLAPPRTFEVSRADEFTVLSWTPTRFEDAYEDEYGRAIEALGGVARPTGRRQSKLEEDG